MYKLATAVNCANLSMHAYTNMYIRRQMHAPKGVSSQCSKVKLPVGRHAPVSHHHLIGVHSPSHTNQKQTTVDLHLYTVID